MDSIKVSDFDIERTLKCGQLFRYEKIHNVYLITHRDRLFKIRQEKSQLLFSGVDREFIIDFFRLDDDYNAIVKSISKDEFMREIIGQNYGMRIMRQDPWECLISYMCSARNKIPKIKQNLLMIFYYPYLALSYQPSLFLILLMRLFASVLPMVSPHQY